MPDLSSPVADDAVLNCPDGWRNMARLFWYSADRTKDPKAMP